MDSGKGKVTLISVDERGPGAGARILSAVLRAADYQTTVIFVPGAVSKDVAFGNRPAFPEEHLKALENQAKGSLFVGISVATCTYHKARAITKHLQQHTGIPVVWGGIHVAAKLEECLQVADMVCLGEGEELVVQLADRIREGKPYEGIPGLILAGGENKTHYQLADLNNLPRPDFDGEEHYILTAKGLEPFGKEGIREVMSTDFSLLPTRGCPYSCTYCVNSLLTKLCQGPGNFRKQGIDSVIEELIWAKENIHGIRRFSFNDDCFMAHKEDVIKQFAKEYKRHIGLPLIIRGVHPKTVSEEKLNALCDAGLIKIRIGIQTGSDRIREIYGRTWDSNKKILEVAWLINRFIRAKKLRFIMFDIITDNPWETEDDRQRTLDLLLSLPRPFGFYFFSLAFYPGTGLYERALAEGLIKGNPQDDAYWTQWWSVEQTQYNDAVQLLSLLSLPRFLARQLGGSGLIRSTARRSLLRVAKSLPELTLYGGTKTAFEADCLLDYEPQNADRGVQGCFAAMKQWGLMEPSTNLFVKPFRRALWHGYTFSRRVKSALSGSTNPA